MKLIVRSRNLSCAPLRNMDVEYPVIYRMGSLTPTDRIRIHSNAVPLEINSVEGCRISSNKILMKERLVKAELPTAEYFLIDSREADDVIISHLSEWKTIIIKRKNSSKGKGIYLIASIDDYHNFLEEIQDDDIRNYIFERFYTYSREYRIHVTRYGCFYAARKMLRRDAEVRWHRHADNSVWIYESNPLFQKPDNWDNMVNDCIKALSALELDIAAFDVKAQNSSTKNPKYIILESNSAPALGELGIEKYQEAIKMIINGKF